MPVARTDTRSDVALQRAGDALAHRGAMRRELRLLQHDEGIDVDEAPAGCRDAAPGLGQQIEAAARRASCSSLDGKMRPDVVHAGGAEQRVAERVTDDVGVGVALEAVGVRDLDAAEHERHARARAGARRRPCRRGAQPSGTSRRSRPLNIETVR